MNFQILETLLNFSQPLDEIKKAIKKLPWDSDDEIIILNNSHIIEILEKYLNEELSADEISEWANLIEGREDIGLESKNEMILKKIIFEMANPEINEPITHYIAIRWMSLLK